MEDPLNGAFDHLWGEGLVDVYCDPDLIVSIAEGWYNSPWGSAHKDFSTVMIRLINRVKQQMIHNPYLRIEISGKRLGPDNYYGRPMRFQRYDIFYGLWSWIDMPDDIDVTGYQPGGFKHYCREGQVSIEMTATKPWESHARVD